MVSIACLSNAANGIYQTKHQHQQFRALLLIQEEKARERIDSDRKIEGIFELLESSTLQRIHRSYSYLYHLNPKPAYINNSQLAK